MLCWTDGLFVSKYDLELVLLLQLAQSAVCWLLAGGHSLKEPRAACTVCGGYHQGEPVLHGCFMVHQLALFFV